MKRLWQIGEEAAWKNLTDFFDTAIANYVKDRDIPGVEKTSKLSPHLCFGEISARQAWHATLFLMDKNPSVHAGAEKFLSELIWRDFNYHQLYHRENISHHDMRNTLLVSIKTDARTSSRNDHQTREGRKTPR